MVKIVELTDKQLVESIDKYLKTLEQLYKDRERRLSEGGDEAQLFTADELKKMEEERKKEADQFSLSLADEDIEAIERVQNQAGQEQEEEDELVRVTTLLRLSKEQLAELNKAKQDQQKNAQKPAVISKGKKVQSLSISKGRIKIKK